MSTTRRAVILIDIQNEYFGGPLEIQYPDRDESLGNIIRVAEKAQLAGLPIAVVRHVLPEESPVFARGSAGAELRAEIASRVQPDWKQVEKKYASVFADTDIEQWLRENGADTVTLVGYMTNNCDFATAAAAEPLGINVEILSDASGAIHLANTAGIADAQLVHETLMTVLNSNFAAVATTDQWLEAVDTGQMLAKGDLGSSAVAGAERFVRAQ
ncbi:isochorismatase family protein [Glutamicibacter sp. BSL13]